MTEKDLKVGQVFKNINSGFDEIVEIVLIDRDSLIQSLEFKTIVTNVYYSREDNGNVGYPYFSFLKAFELINS